jgi:hypothetical protein
MGFTFSPFQSIQGVLWAEEVILGDRYAASNPFRFELVKLNLPGMPDYEPSVPWVCKLRANGGLASELLIYVDDLRVIAQTARECWEACSRVAKILNFLGLQDAARKRRGPEQEPGAWSGSVVHTTGGHVTVLISMERWAKLKSIIQWIDLQLKEEGGMDFKTLEKNRGVLVYISRTYPALVPYLKGVHLTLDSWREWRKEDGWKMTLKEMRAYQIEKGWEEIEPANQSEAKKPPKRVKPVQR